jgi:integrase/recombinase XerD
MTETALGLVKAGSFQVPALIADIGPEATKRYFEFFTVPIRNKNTRIAYYHAIGQFLDWCQRSGFCGLEDIEPITVAAYVEQHPGSPATIKQHMSAIRMLFSWLTEKGILAMNPAREVKTEKFRAEKAKPRPSIPTKCRRSWIELIRATKSAFVIALCLGLLPTLLRGSERS